MRSWASFNIRFAFMAPIDIRLFLAAGALCCSTLGAAEFMLAAPAASAAAAPTLAASPGPPDCRPSAGLEPLLAGKDALLVGEVHGTAESPAFVAETACAALAGGRAVTVALEIPVAEQARLETFLASPGGGADRAALLAGEFWRDPYQDGRRSAAMLALLERLRTLHANGSPLAVLALDPGPGTPGQQREEAMAERLRARNAAAPGDLLVVLTGNYHTRLEPRGSYQYMGALLARSKPDLRLAALDVAYSGGSAWICQSADPAGCKATRLGAKGGAARAQVVTFPALDADGYTGAYGLGELTASPPAAAAVVPATPAKPATASRPAIPRRPPERPSADRVRREPAGEPP